MLTAKLNVIKLRQNWIRCEKDLLHVYGPALRQRGFRLDMPLTVTRTDAELIITQEPPEGRLANNHPEVWVLLQRIAGGDKTAVDSLYSLLLAEGDDRAEVLATLEVSVPQDTVVSADWGTKTEGHATETIRAEVMADRQLCGKVLLLMGCREEVL